MKTAAGIWGRGCEDIIKDVYKVGSSEDAQCESRDDTDDPGSTAVLKPLRRPTRYSSLASAAEHVSTIYDHIIAPTHQCLDIVRAVAGLLHNMRAIKTENDNFDVDYKQGLDYYPKLCEEMATTDRGQVGHDGDSILILTLADMNLL